MVREYCLLKDCLAAKVYAALVSDYSPVSYINDNSSGDGINKILTGRKSASTYQLQQPD